MGIGAIVLGVFAFICMIGGAVLALVPFLGVMLSFLAPVLALVGIILGGVGLSRARSGGGESEGFAIGGLITSVVAFVPSVIVALSCGVCNVCTTAMYLDPNFGTHDAGPRYDAGTPSYTTPNAPPPFTYAPPPFPPSGPTPGLQGPAAPVIPTTAPPPAFPPPPIPSSANVR